MATNEVLQLVTPDQLLVDDNSRFGLKKARLETLKESILQHGEVHTPLDVEELNEPINGKKYRVVDGHYRTQAATELTKTGTPISLPIRVHPEGDPTVRLKRQISFNVSREDPTPWRVPVHPESIQTQVQCNREYPFLRATSPLSKSKRS